MKDTMRDNIKRFYKNYNIIISDNDEINEESKTHYSWQYNIAGMSGVGAWFYDAEVIKTLCHYFKGNYEYLGGDDIMEIEFILDYPVIKLARKVIREGETK
jgi:hypothetical protein